eukprot:TRINITY_DN25221_c0_g2_i1.p1 TRINITY_DN25221_c0_g2~~TRINITY_DN25221_c0_g2_i1.p1  ORF type:complete len:734 (+),score=55.63 TRINITY_DN25221_c0_g2_i1:35-2236(+)
MGASASSRRVDVSTPPAQLVQRIAEAEEELERLRMSEYKAKGLLPVVFVSGLMIGLLVGVALGLGLMQSVTVSSVPSVLASSQIDLDPLPARATTNSTSSELISAVAALTFNILSVANIFHLAGSLTITAVYCFLIGLFLTQDETTIACMKCAIGSVAYVVVLGLMGVRLASHGDVGSAVVGGLLQTTTAYSVLPGVAFVLQACGLTWMERCKLLGSDHLSIVDAGWKLSLALLLTAACGCCSALVLHKMSGFPLLMAPAFLCTYLSFVGLSMLLWQVFRFPFRYGCLQPEILSTLAFGAAMLRAADAFFSARPEVYMGMMVTSLNALLFSLPLVMLGRLERWVPVPDGTNPANLSIYRPLHLLSHCRHVLMESRDSIPFAIAAGIYTILWMSIMTKALRLHLWAARPFALLSMSSLCLVVPHRSRHWALGFRVPLGLWFLGAVVHSETSSENNGDPVLGALLRWLGPHPSEFLAFADSILQVLTASTAMQFLSMGARSLYDAGEHSWTAAVAFWFISLLAMAARGVTSGRLLIGLCLSSWSVGLWLTGIRKAPSWAGAGSRLFFIAVSARLCHIGHDSFLMLCAGVAVICVAYFSLLFGENESAAKFRIGCVNADPDTASAAPSAVAMCVCAGLVGYGAVFGEALLISLGCFCTYASVAAFAAGDDPVSKALLIAGCAVATMLLGEVVQKALGPVQVVLSSVLGTGQPADLGAAHMLLTELVSVFARFGGDE